MDEKSATLLDEIRQLLEQYRKEVPGGRRAWPESIKRRVAELKAGGVKFTEISRRTKIPYYTLVGWKPESRTGRPSFEPVKVVAALPAPANRTFATVTVARKSKLRPKREVVTVTVTTKGGIRIRFEHIGVARIIQLVDRLERSS